MLFPGEDYFTSLSIPSLILSLELMLLELTSLHIRMPLVLLFRQAYWWDLIGKASDISRRCNPTANSLFLGFLTRFLSHLLQCLCALGVGVVLYVYPLWLCSTTLHFNFVWTSILVSICCRENISWWQVRATLICEYKDKYLEHSCCVGLVKLWQLVFSLLWITLSYWKLLTLVFFDFWLILLSRLY